MPNMPGGQIAPLPGNVAPGPAPTPVPQQAQTIPTHVLLLNGVLTAKQLEDENERKELQDDVKEECARYGHVEGIVVPAPPAHLPPFEPGRVVVRFKEVDDTKRCLAVFNGRLFDGQKIQARMVNDEDWERTQEGDWVPLPPPPGSLPAPPGVYVTTPLTINIAGVAALNPAMAGQVQTNPALAGMMAASIHSAAVPLEEGWVKLRGLETQITKQDICEFFKNCAEEWSPEKVRMVIGVDQRPTGEAYVQVSGPRARLRLALAKDRQMMTVSTRPVEVFTSSIDELDRRVIMQGVSYV
jgi:hypothetical protein